MSEPFLGEIKIVSFNFAPKGWAQCNGQLLPINQNQALFALFGTTWGGDGRVNFGLPNLQGRTPIHMGSTFTIGEKAGESAHTLNISELPAHTHTPVGSSNGATDGSPAGDVWPTDFNKPFASSGNTTMSPNCITATGGSQPHENMSPYLVLLFVVALQGIFPSQN